MERVSRIGAGEIRRQEKIGKYYQIEDVLRILEKESIFIGQSGGGITFSGGEPLFQPDFLLEALKACRAGGYHTAVDTSAYSPARDFRAIIPYTNLFLFDIKHLDDSRHFEFTGVSNAGIIENFDTLLQEGADIYARIPVIPGFNDSQDHLRRLKAFLNDRKSSSLKMICLLPYHRPGSSKYGKLGIPLEMNGLKPPSEKRMNELKEYFSDLGIRVKTGG
jgi:pyruvate formate lyase activating enzyme